MFPPISTRRLLRTPGFNSNAGIPGLEEEAAAAINPAPPASTRPRRATLPPAGPGVDVPPMGSNDGTMDAIAQIAARTLGDSTSPTGAPANTPTGSAPITQTPVNGARPRYADPIDNARQEHMLAYDEKKPPRWKQALETAGLAFLQGAASNPQNPLAAGIGAAADGGALGAFKPDMAEEYQFEAYERPGIEEGIQRDQKREDRETQRRKDTFEEIFRAAQAERQLAEAADIPVKRATDQQRYTNEQNRKNAEDQFKRQQHQDLQKYRQDQLELQKGKLQATDKPDYQEGERLFPI